MTEETKNILKFNDKTFLRDLKKYRSIVTYSSATGCFLEVNKRQVRKMASTMKVHYYLTDELYVVKRTSLVII